MLYSDFIHHNRGIFLNLVQVNDVLTMPLSNAIYILQYLKVASSGK